jgi:hypothetical protein
LSRELKMCPEIYCGPSVQRRGSLRKFSHTAKYAPVFGSLCSLQPGLLATISGHILTRYRFAVMLHIDLLHAKFRWPNIPQPRLNWVL